jgi:hypothetical protein
MMKEGTLPDGYTVKRRRLVKVDSGGKSQSSGTKGKKGKTKIAA